MGFRRRAHGDERRRRVLMDELRAGPEGEDAAGEPAQQVPRERTATPRTYSEAAQLSRQPAITCLVPSRVWTLSWLFSLGLVVIGTLEALYINLLLPASDHWRTSLAPLDVTGPANVAQWLASLLLFSAAGYAVVVFHLRRHKLDDFRGRYRIWMAVVLGLLLASCATATNLHEVATILLLRATGTPLFGNGTIWWLLTLGGAYWLLGIRLVFELRESRAALGMMLSAATAYTLGTTVELGLWRLPPTMTWVPGVVQSSALLIGHLCVLFTVLTYLRYVYLDSQGQLRQRRTSTQAGQADRSAAPPRPDRKKRPSRESPAERSVPAVAEMPTVKKRATIRVDAAHETPVSATSIANTTSEGPATPPETPGKKMSKAERRRQRKLMRQQKRAQ